MNYTEKTTSYNQSRYGKPWMAFVESSLSRDFSFIEWDGRPGSTGEFNFTAEPGTLLAYGQKDNRKGKGGVDGYQICMPDGTLPTISSAFAAELRKLDLDARWSKFAQAKLDAALNPPTAEYERAEWARTRNENAARYSAMLGVENPVLAEIAAGLGLAEKQTGGTAAPAEIDISAFGV